MVSPSVKEDAHVKNFDILIFLSLCSSLLNPAPTRMMAICIMKIGKQKSSTYASDFLFHRRLSVPDSLFCSEAWRRNERIRNMLGSANPKFERM